MKSEIYLCIYMCILFQGSIAIPFYSLAFLSTFVFIYAKKKRTDNEQKNRWGNITIVKNSRFLCET